MKIRRYKKAFKNLSFYVNNFGFYKPFQLLMDGTFCFAALQNRIQIREDIPKYFGNDIKFLTTQCVVLETEKLGHKVIGAMQIIKTFGVHNCGHKKKTLSGSDCIMSMVECSNTNRYIIATQDKDLQNKLQNIPAVPILYINRTSVILKAPSESSVRSANDRKQAMLGVTDYQENTLNNLKLKTFGKLEQKVNDLTKFKQAKAPNPLSCQKKKKSIIQNNGQQSSESFKKVDKRRRRRRARLPSHIKEELFNVLTQ